MTHILGITFKENGWNIIHAEKNQQGAVVPKSLSAIPFPTQKPYYEVFDESVFDFLAGQLTEQGFQAEKIALALPMNVAYVKRIAVPRDAEADLLKKQVQWEMGAFLPQDLVNYKIVKADYHFDQGDYLEIPFIAIKKEVLAGIQRLGQTMQAAVERVWTAADAVHNFLQTQWQLQEQNLLYVEVNASLLTFYLFLRGRYYHHAFERVDELNSELIRQRVEHYQKDSQQIINTIRTLSDKDLKVVLAGEESADVELPDTEKVQFNGAELTTGANEAVGLVLGL